MPPSEWRVILSDAASGPLNMAIDEAILQSVGGDQAPPTLRLYAWDPPCLSIGYAQSVRDADLAAIERKGWDVVRRPTGGKAILHTDEITYSIAAPTGHPLFANGVLPSYQRISLGLIAGIEGMGLRPELHESETVLSEDGVAVCFQNPGAFEITVGGKKLVGSAQVRRSDGVLQHGSIPLTGDLGRICAALHFDSEQDRAQAWEQVGEYAITVEHALGKPRAWKEAADQLIAGFEATFETSLSVRDLTPSEHNHANEILRQRYSHPDWTNRI